MRTLILLCLAATLVGVTACNTVEGAGRDMTSAGRAVTDAAKR